MKTDKERTSVCIAREGLQVPRQVGIFSLLQTPNHVSGADALTQAEATTAVCAGPSGVRRATL